MPDMDTARNVLSNNTKYYMRIILNRLAKIILLFTLAFLPSTSPLANEFLKQCDEEKNNIIRAIFNNGEIIKKEFISSDIRIISSDKFDKEVLLSDTMWFYIFKKIYDFKIIIYKFDNSPGMLTEFYKDGSIAFFSDKNDFLYFRQILEDDFEIRTMHDSIYCQISSINVDDDIGRSLTAWINTDGRYESIRSNECYWKSVLLTAGFENLFNIEFSALNKTSENFSEEHSFAFHGKLTSLQSITESEDTVLLSKENVEHRLRDWCASFHQN